MLPLTVFGFQWRLSVWDTQSGQGMGVSSGSNGSHERAAWVMCGVGVGVLPVACYTLTSTVCSVVRGMNCQEGVWRVVVRFWVVGVVQKEAWGCPQPILFGWLQCTCERFFQGRAHLTARCTRIAVYSS